MEKYFFLGKSRRLITILEKWAERSGKSISEANNIMPESGSTVFILGDIIGKINDIVFTLRNDINYYIFADPFKFKKDRKNTGIPILWSNIDISYQLESSDNFKDLFYDVENNPEIDINNLVSLPLYSEKSYEAFEKYLKYVNEVLDVQKSTMVAVLPNARYGVIISAADNQYFKNYVLFMNQYPELASAIEKNETVYYSNLELIEKGANISEDASSGHVAVIPLNNAKETVVAAIVIKFDNNFGEKFPKETLLMVKNLFTSHLSNSFLFDKGGNYVGGCPFLINDDSRNLCWNALEFVPLSILVVDENGKIDYMNQAFQKVLNLDKKAFINKEASRIFDIIIDKTEQETDYYHFYDLTKKELIWKRFDLSEKRTGFVVHEKSSDIQVKQFREIQRLRDVADARGPIVAYDIIGTIKFINRAAGNLLSVNSKDVEEKVSIARFADDDNLINELYAFFKKHNSETDVVYIPYLFKLKDAAGKILKNLTTMTTFSNEHELFVSEIILKNGDKKVAGEDTESGFDESVAKVLEKLTGTISHNFNQSFSVMKLYLDMLNEKLEDDKSALKYIDKLKDEVNKIAKMAKNISSITPEDSIKYVGSTEILNMDKRDDKRDENNEK